MQGGADSGFRHVTPEEYEARLLRFKGQKKDIAVREVTTYLLKTLAETSVWSLFLFHKDTKNYVSTCLECKTVAY